ncbi:MAG: hypothetical protein GX633_00665, partial [Clostridiales bacterium]|nr:hypothetical protein [Clostridiales bacterium]
MERGKSYVYSERAHFMCPNMHFGMLVTIRGEYDGDKLRFCLGALSKAHPFLESVIARDESGRLYFRKTDGLTVPLIECGGEWQKDYDEISLGGWDITRECMLKAVTYPFEGEFRLLLVAHHMLCDGRGLLQLAEELAYCYVKGEQPKYVEERLISSISDLPRGSDLPFLSRAVINYANNRWRKENHRVSYDEYLKFEKKYLQENVTRRSLTTIDGSELEEIIKICREENVSVNDYLIARMMRETGSGKMIIACDIRDKISCYVPGAMGNYSTAFSVVCKTRDGDTVALAKRMSAEVAKIRKRPQREMLVLSCY